MESPTRLSCLGEMRIRFAKSHRNQRECAALMGGMTRKGRVTPGCDRTVLGKATKRAWAHKTEYGHLKVPKNPAAPQNPLLNRPSRDPGQTIGHRRLDDNPTARASQKRCILRQSGFVTLQRLHFDTSGIVRVKLGNLFREARRVRAHRITAV